MSTDAPFTPPKKKPSIFWWLGGAFLLLLFIFFFQLFGPSPRIEISKQTTYITEPLRPDGLPNYEEYVRRKMQEGITPENNAAVLLFRALWPANLEPDQYETVAAELGLEEIPSAESALQPLYGDAMRNRVLAWLPKRSEIEEELDVDAIIDAALDHAWNSQQLPPLSEWVDANQKPLDLIVEASHRPRYYSPSPTFLNDQKDMLINMLLPGAQSLREAARGLKTRAMRNIGENRLNDAWQDNMAMYRLSDLAAQGPTLVEQLVAMAIRHLACQTSAALLSSDQLTKELARQIRNDIAGFTPLANVTKCIDETERISTLDSVVYSSIYGFDALSKSGARSNEQSPVDYAAVDWNIALKRVNFWYDRIVAVTKLPKGETRQRAYADFESDLSADGNRAKQPGQVIAAFFNRNQRSELIGAIMASLMLPALEAATAAEDRTNSILSLTQAAAALAVYRAEHRTYPEKLDDLPPDTLKKLPVDAYLAKPLVYKRIDDGYLLYSPGGNGQDDGGSNEMIRVFEGRSLDEDNNNSAPQPPPSPIPAGADDISIRVPRPPLKLPTSKPPADEP